MEPDWSVQLKERANNLLNVVTGIRVDPGVAITASITWGAALEKAVKKTTTNSLAEIIRANKNLEVNSKSGTTTA